MLVVGILPCIAAYIGIIRAYEERALSLRTSELANQSANLIYQINNCNYLLNPSSEIVDAKLYQLSSIYLGRVVVFKGDLTIVKDTDNLYGVEAISLVNVVQAMGGEYVTLLDAETDYIQIYMPIFQDDNPIACGVLLVTSSAESIRESIEMFSIRGSIILIAAFIIVLAISILASYIIVKPIRKITSSIEGFTEGYENELLHVDTFWETKLLSEEFNKMIGRLKLVDDSRQEFVSNVSHELKTPLTSMKVLSESLLAMEDVPVELYREFMDDIVREIDRENDIINDLLTLVKTDRRTMAINIEKVEINQLLDLILKRLRPIARSKQINLMMAKVSPIIAEVDQVKLTLAISNVIENAIKYNHPKGWVNVSLDTDEKHFYIQVADSGIGIAKDEQEQIFERFYRVDKSHSKEVDGSGLGLSIVRSAVIVHRGLITLHSTEGKGSTFIIRIPLQYSP